jgi:hypothetical protein
MVRPAPFACSNSNPTAANFYNILFNYRKQPFCIIHKINTKSSFIKTRSIHQYFSLSSSRKVMDAVTNFVTYTTTASTATATTAATATMVCHPVWSEHDMRNWPVWPWYMILPVTFAVMSIFILCMRITAYWTKKRALKRLKAGPVEELAERLRIEMVRNAMEPRREGDPRAAF